MQHTSLKKLVKTCPDCYGYSDMSQCCGEMAEPTKNTYVCGGCGKFCRADVCHTCEGYGELTFEKGTEVRFFISKVFDANSSCYGIEELYKRFKIHKKEFGKSFTGVVKGVACDSLSEVVVKVDGVGMPVSIDIDYLEWNN